MLNNGLPLSYYPPYRKALRDLKSALEKGEGTLKRCSMNNAKGVIAMIDLALKDPEKLMMNGSFEGYELPEKYYQNLQRWKKRRRKGGCEDENRKNGY